MNICILYYIPNKTIKYNIWHDGFTKAIEILKNSFIISMINTFDKPKINFENYDIVFFKESFTGNIYNFYKSFLLKKNKIGLFISSSNIIPNNKQLELYDILFYETFWYYNYANLKRHSNSFHAFGVDTDIMKKTQEKKIYDVIFVGNICAYKRPLNILKLSGKKICLGFKTDNNLIKKLIENNVEIVEFIEYDKLAKYYNQSKLCYVPCTIHGGGERSVLEARSCGITIKVEDDNPKLKELIKSELYSSKYYAKQIKLGIQEIFHIKIEKPIINHEKIKSLQTENIYKNLSFNSKLEFWKLHPLIGNIIIKPDKYKFNMYCNNDDTVVKELYWSNFNNWENNEIKTIINLCKEKKYNYFFDIGSYTGFYSLLVNTILSNTVIYSFEIIPEIYERLLLNKNINKSNNITSYNIGVSNKNSIKYIKKGSFINGLSSVSYITSNKTENSIKTISIDSFVNDKKINNENILIKIDTVGTEEEVINGMLNLIKNNKVDLLIDIGNNNIEKYKKILKDHKLIKFKNNVFFIQ